MSRQSSDAVTCNDHGDDFRERLEAIIRAVECVPGVEVIYWDDAADEQETQT